MNDWKCEFCIYFKKVDNSSGVCQRFPPVIVQKGNNIHWLQPIVETAGTVSDTCGEWKENPSRKFRK